jgi:predicted nucleic acid-binding protein
MTSYVVDASVVAEFIIGGTYTSNARALFLGALEGDQFSVPDLCLAECTNVIWKMVLFHGMPSDQAIMRSVISGHCLSSAPRFAMF